MIPLLNSTRTIDVFSYTEVNLAYSTVCTSESSRVKLYRITARVCGVMREVSVVF